MKLYADAAFNLLVNAVGSFWLGLVATGLAFALWRRTRDSSAVLLWLLPFAKLVWDLRHGIPHSSFFWAAEHGERQRLGSFQIGVGATPWGLSLQGLLWAERATGRSTQSVGDLALRALQFRVSALAAPALSCVLLACSTFRVGRSCLGLSRFRRLTARLGADTTPEFRRVGHRVVRVFVSPKYRGVPFAGGLLRPYIVLPAALETRLTASEREAVIQHELGHIACWDLWLLLPLELLSQLFWYVPGIWPLLSHVQRLLEQRADDAPLTAGIRPEVVASALLVVGEFTLETGAPLLAMCRTRSTLAARVRRLLEPETQLRTTRLWLVVLRTLVISWLVLGLLQASACGNHP